jgi:hypothetical protein
MSRCRLASTNCIFYSVRSKRSTERSDD